MSPKILTREKSLDLGRVEHHPHGGTDCLGLRAGGWVAQRYNNERTGGEGGAWNIRTRQPLPGNLGVHDGEPRPGRDETRRAERDETLFEKAWPFGQEVRRLVCWQGTSTQPILQESAAFPFGPEQAGILPVSLQNLPMHERCRGSGGCDLRYKLFARYDMTLVKPKCKSCVSKTGLRGHVSMT